MARRGRNREVFGGSFESRTNPKPGRPAASEPLMGSAGPRALLSGAGSTSTEGRNRRLAVTCGAGGLHCRGQQPLEGGEGGAAGRVRSGDPQGRGGGGHSERKTVGERERERGEEGERRRERGLACVDGPGPREEERGGRKGRAGALGAPTQWRRGGLFYLWRLLPFSRCAPRARERSRGPKHGAGPGAASSTRRPSAAPPADPANRWATRRPGPSPSTGRRAGGGKGRARRLPPPLGRPVPGPGPSPGAPMTSGRTGGNRGGSARPGLFPRRQRRQAPAKGVGRG